MDLRSTSTTGSASAPPELVGEHANRTEPDIVVQALRLGYLIVETFGRLKRQAAPVRQAHRDAYRRFAFSSKRGQDEVYRTLQSAAQLTQLAATLELTPPPEFLKAELLQGTLERKVTADELNDWYTRLDEWSQLAEIRFSVQNELAANAFVYGGSLADTYWHGHSAHHADRLARYREQLHYGRLRQITERMESMRAHLPPYTVEALGHTLMVWRLDPRVDTRAKELETPCAENDPERKSRQSQARTIRDRLDLRLGRQTAVWRDILFGRRPPESFLTSEDRNRVLVYSYLTTSMLVTLGLLIFWLVLWSVPTLIEGIGLNKELRPAAEYIENELPRIETPLDGLVEAGSAIVATISAVTVFVTGMVARVSGWILRLHNHVDFFFRSRFIQRRALRKPPAPAELLRKPG